ncbi:MAG: hypothetical protein VW405_01695 [Rhodospirillaceae bacterium]
MSDPITQAVELLNDVLERDPKAITKLVNMRVDCDDKLASHPTLQVQKFGTVHRIGILGLLNGALGGGPSGDIGAQGTLDPNTGEFTRIKRFVDLRAERLDVLA